MNRDGGNVPGCVAVALVEIEAEIQSAIEFHLERARGVTRDPDALARQGGKSRDAGDG